MNTTAVNHTGEVVLADDRFVVKESGDVDCLVCGKGVCITSAYKIETNIGPDMYAHKTCAEGFSPEQIGRLYHMAVNGFGRNHGMRIPGTDADILLRLR
ncbi:MAG: hypothetical protein ACKVW3_01920 [Phycisphaerales bacterium]